MVRASLVRLIVGSWEALIALFCVAGALPYLAGAPQPQSVEEVFPGWLRVAWGTVLLAGGVGVLAGLASGRRWIERPALWLLGGGALAYAIAIVGLNGFERGGLAAAIVAATGAACLLELGRRRLLAWLERG